MFINEITVKYLKIVEHTEYQFKAELSQFKLNISAIYNTNIKGENLS